MHICKRASLDFWIHECVALARHSPRVPQLFRKQTKTLRRTVDALFLDTRMIVFKFRELCLQRSPPRSANSWGGQNRRRAVPFTRSYSWKSSSAFTYCCFVVHRRVDADGVLAVAQPAALFRSGGQPFRGRDPAPRAAPPDAACGRTRSRRWALGRRWFFAWDTRRRRPLVLRVRRRGGAAQTANWGRRWVSCCRAVCFRHRRAARSLRPLWSVGWGPEQSMVFQAVIRAFISHVNL